MRFHFPFFCVFLYLVSTTGTVRAEAFEPFLKRFCDSANSAPVYRVNSRVKLAKEESNVASGDFGAFAIERTIFPLKIKALNIWEKELPDETSEFLNAEALRFRLTSLCTCGGTPVEASILSSGPTAHATFNYDTECSRTLHFNLLKSGWYLNEASFSN
jgi:hypothetical protein